MIGQQESTERRLSNTDISQVYSLPPGSTSAEGSAFHSQFEHFAQPQIHSASHGTPYAHPQQPLDMGAMATALPQQLQSQSMTATGYHGRPEVPMIGLPQFQARQPSQHPAGRGGLQFDPAAMARFQQQQQQFQQQQQQQQQQYMGQHQYMQHSPRSPTNTQGQGAFHSFIDPYGFAMNPAQMGQFDPRFAGQNPYGMASTMPYEMQPYPSRPVDSAPIPSFPRGPPRKPKQSGHALWVGNLPAAANVTDLKDHFSRDATKDIESLFLISKSNCAFVNYQTEAACLAAMNRFHNSNFHGVRLVCRLRRGTNMSSPEGIAAATAPEPPSPAAPGNHASEPDTSSPTIVGGQPSAAVTPQSSNETSSTTISSNSASTNTGEKYFIVKSLTAQDLEASVRNGVWATQSHNEAILNRAYEEADNVYLIFSANKSGEYFGYARMSSAISGEPINLSSGPAGGGSGARTTAGGNSEEPYSPGAPQSIPTPATATAPKGRIIDDSARGTIFWEAEQEELEDRGNSPDKSGESGGMVDGISGASGNGGDGQNWGRQFSIEWLSTTRLPFHRTRGLRNPWNANREVKIARDGTELEPGIGKRLVSMFYRPPHSPAAANPAA